MEKLVAIIIAILATLGITQEIVVDDLIFGAPQNRGNVVRNITPEADSLYYLGSTTRKFLGTETVNSTSTNKAYGNEFCINNSSPDCKDSWAAVGEPTRDWKFAFDNAITPTTTATGIYVTASSTIDSTLRVHEQLTIIGTPDFTADLSIETNSGLWFAAVDSADQNYGIFMSTALIGVNKPVVLSIQGTGFERNPQLNLTFDTDDFDIRYDGGTGGTEVWEVGSFVQPVRFVSGDRFQFEGTIQIGGAGFTELGGEQGFIEWSHDGTDGYITSSLGKIFIPQLELGGASLGTFGDAIDEVDVRRTVKDIDNTNVTGTGLIQFGGEYASSTSATYKVEITGSGGIGIIEYKWSDSGGTVFNETGLVTSISPREMNNGFKVWFTSGTLNAGDFATATAIATSTQLQTLIVDTRNNRVGIGTSSPAYLFQVGDLLNNTFFSVSSAGSATTSGSFFVGNTLWNGTKNLTEYNKFFDGTTIHAFDALVQADVIGGTASTTVERAGGGDITVRFSTGDSNLDCAPTKCVIQITPGDDDAPQKNYIYVLESDPTNLAISTSDWPSAEHVKITFLFCPSIAEIQAESGCYINQNWNDFAFNTNMEGGWATASECFRYGLGYFSGLDPNGIDQDTNASYFNSISATEAYYKASSGSMCQKNMHAMPAVDSLQASDDMHVVNSSVVAYREISDLTDITLDSLGGSFSNKYFALCFFEIGNKTSQYNPTMIKLPKGSYVSQSAAENDTSGFDDCALPREFVHDAGVGIPVVRMVLRYTGGFGTLSHISSRDLREAGNGSGATGVGVTTFPGLTDTPTSYSGEALNILQVNAGETALEFTGSPTFDNLAVTDTLTVENLVLVTGTTTNWTVLGNATTTGWFNVGTTDVVGTLGTLIGDGDLFVGGNATVTGNFSPKTDSISDLGNDNTFFANTYTSTIHTSVDSRVTTDINKNLVFETDNQSFFFKNAQGGLVNLILFTTDDFRFQSANSWQFSNTVRPTSDSSTDLGTDSIFWDEIYGDEIVLQEGTMGTTAADQTRLAGLDLSAGDAGLHIKTENDTEHLFASLVGINTVTPTETLEVNGTTLLGGNVTSTGWFNLGATNGISELLGAGDLFVGNNATTTGNQTVGKLILTSAGTASDTAISFAGDANTGLFFPTTDTFALSAGGIELIRGREDSAVGLVGIGDTTADFKLEIQGTVGLGYFGITNSADGDIFTIDPNGNVGIGTASPGDLLEVIGAIRTDTRFVIEASGEQNLWNIDNSGGTLRFFREDFSASGPGSSGSVKMTITDAGVVDISGDLEVSGVADFTGNVKIGTIANATDQMLHIERADTNVIQVLLQNTDTSVGYGASAGFARLFVGGTEKLRLGSAVATFNQGQVDTNFNVRGDNDANLLFVNAGTDRIGISVSSPSAKLHIDQSSTSAAIPTLILDQADISEGLINFIGSDRGTVVTGAPAGATLSVASIRVEINGVIYVIPLFADQ